MADQMIEELLAIFREEALELTERTLAALNRAVNSTGEARQKEMTEVCRLLHTLKGAAAAADHEEISTRAHALEDRMALVPVQADIPQFDPIFRELEAIEALVRGREGPSAVEAPPPLASEPAKATVSLTPERLEPKVIALNKPNGQSAAAQPERPTVGEWLRVQPERIDQLYAHLGELVLARLQQDELIDRIVQLRTNAAEAVARQREVLRALSDAKSELRPETYRKLKAHIDGLGAGVNAFLDDLQGVTREARALEAQAAVVSQNIEESIQELRLMPLAPFFDGFGKVVRDAARRSNKLVRFEVRANGAEVDRSVLSRLSDALLHLVRNAVVHGIESPAERRAKDKPEQGELVLEATTLGTHALIHIRDDGAGVNAEKVRKKAREVGVPDSEDLLDILTHPGFSTRDEADDLAGRGVGLNVVQNIVRGLGGSLDLTSTPGQGTVFTIQVPIAASTTMGLILDVGEHRFGIMLSDVECVIRPSADDIVHVEGRAAVRVGDDLVAIVALADILGIDAKASSEERLPVVVVKQLKKRLALAVSEIPGEHALVVRPFGRAFRGTDIFVGGAVQPDHSVVPVLSTSAVFARALRTNHGNIARHIMPQRSRSLSQYRALVVDDSITMRTLLKNVLTAAGYQVAIAEDGRSALSIFESMGECHVVVTDLQMPHMDGVELCRNIRARDRSYVPIVMVTSVDDDDEKHRALAAGADAYVVKSTFEQNAFLKRVDTLVRGPQ